MVKTKKLIATSLIAAIALAVAVGTATAGRLASSTERFTATWAELTFTGSAGGITIAIKCRLTLSGSLHRRTITKAVGSLIGSVTDARTIRPCTEGEMRPLTETLPWVLTYEGFEGTLPNITGVRVLLRRARFLTQSGIACSASYGNETDNLSFRITREAGGSLTTMEFLAGRNILTLVTRLGGLACPGTLTFTGGGTVGAGVRITLI